MVGFGALLAGALFMRQGGPAALIHSAGSLHTNQGSGFYGQLGIWMLIGTALYAFAAILRSEEARSRSEAPADRQRAACRGLHAGPGLARLHRLRPARRRGHLPAPAGPARAQRGDHDRRRLILAAGLEFAAIVRTNAASTDLGTAVERTVETPVPAFQTADLSVFDDFVAMQGIVPSSISRLDGSSLLQIPAALAPRALWPGKPQPLDNLVTEYLYPGATAGTPITMQGELYWNFGMPGVALGSLLIGAADGLVDGAAVQARSAQPDPLRDPLRQRLRPAHPRARHDDRQHRSSPWSAPGSP